MWKGKCGKTDIHDRSTFTAGPPAIMDETDRISITISKYGKYI